MAQHSIPVSMKESPFWKKFPLIWLFSISPKKWNHLNFYKRNPYKNESDQKKRFHKKLKSPSILQEKSLLKKCTFIFIWEIPWKIINWNRLQFYKRYPFTIFCLQFYKKIPLKIILTHLQFYKRNPFKFFEKTNKP